jgi:hypothetical protein
MARWIRDPPSRLDPGSLQLPDWVSVARRMLMAAQH